MSDTGLTPAQIELQNAQADIESRHPPRVQQSADPDEVSIVIGTTSITGWANVALTRSVEAFPNNFVLTASDQFPDDPTRATVFGDGPGQNCQIKIGSDIVVTGYVDRYGIDIGPGRHDVTITGRGLCQDLADCSADLMNNPAVNGATMAAKSTLDLAQKLCKSFGITAKSATTDLGKPVQFLTVALGETSYEIIEKVARYAGYLVYEDQSGALVLDRVGALVHSSGFTMPGNIESASSTLSIDQRFSHYTVVWNSVAQYSEISPILNNRADAKDDAFISQFPKRYRPRIIVSEQYDPDAEYGQQRADWEKARRIGRSQAISLTCDSWRDSSGALWTPNMLAPINAPALKIVNKNWVIGTVTYRKDASGTHADLILMPPDAFNPEPSPLHLWDREIMHATPAGGASAAAASAPTGNATAASNGLQGRV